MEEGTGSFGESCFGVMKSSSITCQSFVDLISGHLEDNLPASRHTAFELHRASCGKCAHYLSNYQKAIAAAKDSFDDDNSELGEKLVQRIVSARPRSYKTGH